MSYQANTACHLLRSTGQDHRTPQGEDTYYREHSVPTLYLPSLGFVASVLRRSRAFFHATPPSVPVLK